MFKPDMARIRRETAEMVFGGYARHEASADRAAEARAREAHPKGWAHRCHADDRWTPGAMYGCEPCEVARYGRLLDPEAEQRRQTNPLAGRRWDVV